MFLVYNPDDYKFVEEIQNCLKSEGISYYNSAKPRAGSFYMDESLTQMQK